MSELTRDVVRKAPQIFNAIKQRELNLRGLHLNQLPLTDSHLWTAIVSSFDTLDLSDNLIQWLDSPSILSVAEQQEQQQQKQKQQEEHENSSNGNPANAEVDDFLSFLLVQDNTSKLESGNTAPSASSSKALMADTSSLSKKLTPIRISTIIAHRNGLKGISKPFASQLKKSLRSLVLHDNGISDFASCDVFGAFQVLERLSLLRNPVRDHQGYRNYLIGTCSNTLKLLDFNKVKDEERKNAKEFLKKYKQQHQDSSLMLSMDNATTATAGVTVGAGRRAARKAAAAGNTAVNDDTSALASKRARDATENQLSSGNGNEVTSISTKIGQAVANSNKNVDESAAVQPAAAGGGTKTKKKHTRDELMKMMDEATTLEEMDEIERMMNELD